MQKDGDKALKGTKLGMEKLYKHILKTELPSKLAYSPCIQIVYYSNTTPQMLTGL